MRARTGRKRRAPRRRARGRTRRRAFRRKRDRASKLVIRSPFGISDTAFVRLSYQDVGQIALSGGTNNAVDYYGNSCAQPVVANSAKLVSYFNEWSNFYKQAIVYSSKIEVTVVDLSGSTASGWFIAVVPINSTFTPLSIASAMVQPRSKYMFVQEGSGRPSKIKHYMSTAQVWGVSKRRVTDDPEFSHLMATTSIPTSAWFWNVFISPGVATGFSAFGILSVRLTYYIKLWDRHDASQTV